MDFGSGDGVLVRHLARLHPDVLVVGVDANADNLREAARRARLKPAKRGAQNAVFGRFSLENAPGEFTGLADALTVYFPWGSLLKAVAQPELISLARLRELCKPYASVHIVFGYDAGTDQSKVSGLALPSLSQPASLIALEQEYRKAGFAVSVRQLTPRQIREMPTTWAKKLSFSGRSRPFVEIVGNVRWGW